MQNLQNHFRKHGAIHATWAIMVLVAIIVSQVLGTINGDKINDFISFASSLASLILAVVAIFYAMISNQSFSETIGSLKLSAASVEKAAERVCDVTGDLGRKSDQLTSQLADFSPALSRVSERLDQFSLPEGGSDADVSGEASARQAAQNPETNGVRVAIYAIYLSKRHTKPIILSRLFQDLPEHKQSWTDYVAGYLAAVHLYEPLGIKLEREPDAEEYLTLSLGRLTEDAVYSRVGRLPDTDYFLTLRKGVDRYFEESELPPTTAATVPPPPPS